MDSRQRARLIVASIGMSLVTTLATVAVARIVRRRGADPARDARRLDRREQMRVFVTTRFNPVVTRLGLVGGRQSRWAYVEHVGRRSGIVRRTPVLPMLADDRVFIPLPYGVDVDWARNVRAAGHCRMQLRGAAYDLDEPAIVTAAEHPLLREPMRSWHLRRDDRYLRLHVLAQVPGTLDEANKAAPPDAASPIGGPAPAEPTKEPAAIA